MDVPRAWFRWSLTEDGAIGPDRGKDLVGRKCDPFDRRVKRLSGALWTQKGLRLRGLFQGRENEPVVTGAPGVEMSSWDSLWSVRRGWGGREGSRELRTQGC